jgi:hypothetical protein
MPQQYEDDLVSLASVQSFVLGCKLWGTKAWEFVEACVADGGTISTSSVTTTMGVVQRYNDEELPNKESMVEADKV